MPPTPPPLPSSGENRFRQFARASWLSVVIMCGANVFIQGAAAQTGPQATRLIRSVLTVVMASIGVLAGIVALCGIPRYGRKGLLWPALTGLGIWLLLFVSSIAVFNRAQEIAKQRRHVLLSPASHSPVAERFEDAELGFAFDLPDGYQALEPSPPGFRHAFIGQVPNSSRVLLIKPLGGTLDGHRLQPAELPPSKGLSLTTFQWRGLAVDGTRVPEKLDGQDYITFNIQIPLRGQAVQFGFGGPANAEAEVRKLAEQALTTFAGETNL